MVHLIIGISAVIVNVGIQSLTVVLILKYVFKAESRGKIGDGLLYDTVILSTVMVMFFCAHLIQIAVWAELFILCGEFSKFNTAFYHSMVNFSSLGYGDIVMSEKWRLLGSMEAVSGILMFGISTAVFFAVLRRTFRDRVIKMKKQI